MTLVADAPVVEMREDVAPPGRAPPPPPHPPAQAQAQSTSPTMTRCRHPRAADGKSRPWQKRLALGNMPTRMGTCRGLRRRLARSFGLCAALACALALTAAIVDAAAAPGTAAKARARITPAGVDGVKLGETYAQLRAGHLVGGIGKGCELAGPGARSASLRAPLKGSVDFTMTTPRKVTDISVRGGATARGVGVGATIAQIKAAYPKAKIDHSTDHTFGVTLVRIPKNGGGKLQFAVDTKTHRVTLIGIPLIAFCE